MSEINLKSSNKSIKNENNTCTTRQKGRKQNNIKQKLKTIVLVNGVNRINRISSIINSNNSINSKINRTHGVYTDARCPLKGGFAKAPAASASNAPPDSNHLAFSPKSKASIQQNAVLPGFPVFPSEQPTPLREPLRRHFN